MKVWISIEYDILLNILNCCVPESGGIRTESILFCDTEEANSLSRLALGYGKGSEMVAINHLIELLWVG